MLGCVPKENLSQVEEVQMKAVCVVVRRTGEVVGWRRYR